MRQTYLSVTHTISLYLYVCVYGTGLVLSNRDCMVVAVTAVAKCKELLSCVHLNNTKYKSKVRQQQQLHHTNTTNTLKMLLSNIPKHYAHILTTFIFIIIQIMEKNRVQCSQTI